MNMFDLSMLDESATADALVQPDVLASIMQQLGLACAHRCAAVSTAWRHASLALQEERRVLRPSHSLGWGNEVLGQFRSPSGITFAANGELCVADTNNHRLQVLSRAGQVRCVFGHGPGSRPNEFQQPTGLACDGGFLYVADSGNCRLHKLSLPGGEVRATVGVFGDQPGQLHAPVGLTLYDGRLYCADSRNHRISVFTTSPGLRYVTSFGSHGSGPGELGTTSSGIYLAAYQGELFVADRSNHRLQVLGIDGRFHRSIGCRGTAPGCFRRLRGVAAAAGRLITAECERVQVLTLDGTPLQVLQLPGSSALVGICADSTHVCVVDQTHQKIRVLSMLDREVGAAFDGRPPQDGELHVRPFLLPTATCDAQHPSIVELARRLIPVGCSPARAAATVRHWVRANIAYSLRDKSEPASQTLACREGMCTNKASLQIALLRAAGVPSGYVIVNISKEAFNGPQLLPETYELISPTTVHVFCACYIPYTSCSCLPASSSTSPPLGRAGSSGGDSLTAALPRPSGPEWPESGSFRYYDAVERLGGTHLTEYVPYSDETRFQQRWLRGPFSPVQCNLDHMLTPGSKIPPPLLERQNELYRAHPV